MYKAKSATRFERYGLYWPQTISPLQLEFDMIRNGGRWIKQSGGYAGEGLFYHWAAAIQLLWPDHKPHRWYKLLLKCYLEYKYIGVMGCGSGGKSDSLGRCVLLDWYLYPGRTTVLISSTTLQMLNLRVFGMIKSFHRAAKERWPWLPGSLIEGKQMIIHDERHEAALGRDFRNGIIGIPCKRGQGTYVGLGEYIGVHNKRVVMLADELSMMPRAFMDSTANLSKCPYFKLAGLGNPNETTNAHGFLCEPAAHLGGWDGGIDQMPKTKTWETRFPQGVCVHLPGSDNPNMDVPEGVPAPYEFLITREQMAQDAQIWGINDWHYTMMVEGKMPRGQGSRRVITRQMCEKFGALTDPNWLNTNRTRIAALDAAYRGLGGDRCVFLVLEFGDETPTDQNELGELAASIINQSDPANNRHKILALIDVLIVPVVADKDSDLPEDQIVKFVMAQCLARNIAPENFFFDSGMRTSLVTAFGRLWSPNVNSIDCGGTPSERKVSSDIDVICKDYYSKKITELWYSVRLIIEAGQFRGMTKDVMNEGCAREFKRVGANKVEVESKEEMKTKTGYSPDLFDALCIGCEGARQRGFIIKRLGSDRRKREDHGWKKELKDRAQTLWRSKELNHSA